MSRKKGLLAVHENLRAMLAEFAVAECLRELDIDELATPSAATLITVRIVVAG